MDQNLHPKMLRYVAVSSALAKKALDELGIHQQDAGKAAALRPDVLQQMLETETLAAGQKEAADKMLSTHEGTVQLLRNAITKIAELAKNQKQAGDLGQGVTDPAVAAAASGADVNNPHYVGGRTSVKKASDIALMEGLGLSVQD